MNVELINNSGLCTKKVEYVVDFLLERFDFSADGLQVIYGGELPSANGSKVLYIRSMPLEDYTGLIVNLSENPLKGIKFSTVIEVEYDLIDFVFSLLNETVRWMPLKKDVHGRIKPNISVNYKIPVIDLVLDVLISKVNTFYQLHIEYKKERGTCSVSHDIDNIAAFESPISLLRAIKRIVSKGGFGFKMHALIRLFVDFMRGKDPYYNFDYILEEVESYRLTSTFYFIMGGITKYEGRYKANDYKTLIRDLCASRHMVGLHPSYDAGINPNILADEVNVFNEITDRQCEHVRYHYLRFDNQNIANDLNQESILTDSSSGFASHCGFRNGTCHPFRKWLDSTGSASDTKFLPLPFMDTTVLGYMLLDAKGALLELRSVIEQVVRYRGHLDLLWHNSNMYYYNGLDEKQLFRNSLELMVRSLTPESIENL